MLAVDVEEKQLPNGMWAFMYSARQRAVLCKDFNLISLFWILLSNYIIFKNFLLNFQI